MCPMTRPVSSFFDWNATPLLVKELIVDTLNPRSLPIFGSLSRECYYLYDKRRRLHVVDAMSIFIKIEADGNFKAEIVEGEDVDDEQDKGENVFDRSASSHLGLSFVDHEKTVFDNNLKQLKTFLRHVHAVNSVELDVSCEDSDAAGCVLREIWQELGAGLESVHKLILHRFPDKYLSNLFKKAERIESLALLSCRRSINDQVDPEVLIPALQLLPKLLHRFVCDYHIRPNDELLDLVAEKSSNLQLLYIFGVSEEAIQEFIYRTKFGHKCKIIFSFSEGFYQWTRVESALKTSAEWFEKLRVNNLPAAFHMKKAGADIFVGLIKPYRAFL